MVLNTKFESYKSDSILETCQRLRNTEVGNVLKSIFSDARFLFLIYVFIFLAVSSGYQAQRSVSPEASGGAPRFNIDQA